jgi:hypothetical protein
VTIAGAVTLVATKDKVVDLEQKPMAADDLFWIASVAAAQRSGQSARKTIPALLATLVWRTHAGSIIMLLDWLFGRSPPDYEIAIPVDDVKPLLWDSV